MLKENTLKKKQSNNKFNYREYILSTKKSKYT